MQVEAIQAIHSVKIWLVESCYFKFMIFFLKQICKHFVLQSIKIISFLKDRTKQMWVLT